MGFTGDMIHVYNKNENAIHSSDYFDNISHRENLLLLGDSLGDLRMAEGAGDLECMLKIGFLNFKVSTGSELAASHLALLLVFTLILLLFWIAEFTHCFVVFFLFYQLFS